MLIDSDVLVLHTRGNIAAAQRVNAIQQWQISVVTYMELAQGCSDKPNLERLKKGLAARKVKVLHITPAISQRAADLVDALALSHGMRLADALIAATAIEHGMPLLTGNLKHFSPVAELTVEPFVL